MALLSQDLKQRIVESVLKDKLTQAATLSVEVDMALLDRCDHMYMMLYKLSR